MTSNAPPSGQTDYVTLVSCDGFEFKVQRSSAEIAEAIRRMLDPRTGFYEAIHNRCEFSDITGLVLEKVVEYLYYNEKNKDAKEVPDMEIPPEMTLEVLMAADFLNV
ncbi:putative Elongin-C [Aulographum hederae CBS 113979]|uniref:Elongin-C n=1 Tax=Aulographum hederae CBS 113979 TaxID=1176131 RepID=A0A6G1H7W0_9PEZI|nr:putative Elongin-C [Aulographum hederae CBS 113979]